MTGHDSNRLWRRESFISNSYLPVARIHRSRYSNLCRKHIKERRITAKS